MTRISSAFLLLSFPLPDFKEKMVFISQDSHQLSSCAPGCSGYRVRSVYCTKRLLQAHLCSSSRRHDWFSIMQITNRWKCCLGWCSCLGYLSGCDCLWTILCSDVSSWSQMEAFHWQAEGEWSCLKRHTSSQCSKFGSINYWAIYVVSNLCGF